METSASLNPYLRVQQAGLDIEVRHHTRTYDIRLVNGAQIIAHKSAPRTRTISLAQAVLKAKNGRWGPTSGFCKALVALADVAESFASNKPTTN